MKVSQLREHNFKYSYAAAFNPWSCSLKACSLCAKRCVNWSKYCAAALPAIRFFMLSISTRARNCLSFNSISLGIVPAAVSGAHWLSVRPSSSAYSSALTMRTGSDLRVLGFLTCLPMMDCSSTNRLSPNSSSYAESESSCVDTL